MAVSDPGETRLTDEPLAAEIELLGEVIAVAATHPGSLTPDQVDEVLGVPEPDLVLEPELVPELVPELEPED